MFPCAIGKGISMDFDSIRACFTEDIGAVDRALRAHLERASEPYSHYGMLRYHLGFANESLKAIADDSLRRGKRLRPIACLLICRALGAPAGAAEQVMVAAELMHAASLAHDDIEDEDPVRWGRPTLWSLFGSGQAINAGDALIGMTYQLLLGLPQSGVSPDTALQVIEAFSQAHLKMCEGQHLDLLYRGRFDVGVDTYLDIISRKTAAALECIALAAALVAVRDPEIRGSYQQFGRAFGMLYQICDDIRAVWAEPQGKEKVAGNDVRLRKPTLPLLLGLQMGAPRLRALFSERSSSGALAAEHAEIAEELRRLGVEASCLMRAASYRDEAIAHLRSTAHSSPAHDLLEMMVRICAQSAGVQDSVLADAAQ
ncbi:polyprenyl synthetase family protein [Sorangium sp. So ce260]|uniref:polyprenyl synthetase family protein n=1 Tax=Sorangium sp. So ce260 TaxID=3133291 RepID=UPI003F5E2067